MICLIYAYIATCIMIYYILMMIDLSLFMHFSLFFLGFISDDLSITIISDQLNITTDNSYSIYFAMVGMTSSSYLLSYYNATIPVLQHYGYGIINTYLITVTNDNTNSIMLSLSNATALIDSSAIFSMAMTNINNNTAVITYTDYNHNYAIYCQSIHLQIDEESKLTSIGNKLKPSYT